MYRSDDIANLFHKLGESAENYREIESDLEFLEEPLPAPECTVLAPSAPAVERSRPLGELLAAASRRRENRQTPMQPDAASGPRIVALVSGKGGVGRSTLAAALTCALQDIGGRTVALDLDPQNALCLNLGGDAEQPGLVQADIDGLTWNNLLQPGFCHSQYLPFGPASLEQQRLLEQRLRSEPHWLAEHLAVLGLGAGDRLIVDLPAGASAYLDQVLTIADLVLVVTLPDAASYHALKRIEQLLQGNGQRANAAPCRYLINRLDSSRAFSLDMGDILQGHLDTRLLGVVQQDNYLGESLAYARNPLARHPASPGCRDLLAVASSLAESLRQTARQEPSPT
ncbi:cellulose biosynthesis protein BcsQ [Pseudomonas citronellolis]|uniref:cellulose biosynthesis protein BcsQ n=1 Tax=Pseudomonas citronellolis TaxID=53408 RepID=UPI00248E17C3|nr:cellulose biosynthesis protein BcsQ [Pseudomonas citronellolis]